jgi:hypothetical protein
LAVAGLCAHACSNVSRTAGASAWPLISHIAAAQWTRTQGAAPSPGRG